MRDILLSTDGIRAEIQIRDLPMRINCVSH